MSGSITTDEYMLKIRDILAGKLLGEPGVTEEQILALYDVLLAKAKDLRSGNVDWQRGKSDLNSVPARALVDLLTCTGSFSVSSLTLLADNYGGGAESDLSMSMCCTETLKAQLIAWQASIKSDTGYHPLAASMIAFIFSIQAHVESEMGRKQTISDISIGVNASGFVANVRDWARKNNEHVSDEMLQQMLVVVVNSKVFPPFSRAHSKAIAKEINSRNYHPAVLLSRLYALADSIAKGIACLKRDIHATKSKDRGENDTWCKAERKKCRSQFNRLRAQAQASHPGMMPKSISEAESVLGMNFGAHNMMLDRFNSTDWQPVYSNQFPDYNEGFCEWTNPYFDESDEYPTETENPLAPADTKVRVWQNFDHANNASDFFDVGFSVLNPESFTNTNGAFHPFVKAILEEDVKRIMEAAKMVQRTKFFSNGLEELLRIAESCQASRTETSEQTDPHTSYGAVYSVHIQDTSSGTADALHYANSISLPDGTTIQVAKGGKGGKGGSGGKGKKGGKGGGGSGGKGRGATGGKGSKGKGKKSKIGGTNKSSDKASPIDNFVCVRCLDLGKTTIHGSSRYNPGCTYSQSNGLNCVNQDEWKRRFESGDLPNQRNDTSEGGRGWMGGLAGNARRDILKAAAKKARDGKHRDRNHVNSVAVQDPAEEARSSSDESEPDNRPPKKGAGGRARKAKSKGNNSRSSSSSRQSKDSRGNDQTNRAIKHFGKMSKKELKDAGFVKIRRPRKANRDPHKHTRYTKDARPDLRGYAETKDDSADGSGSDQGSRGRRGSKTRGGSRKVSKKSKRKRLGREERDRAAKSQRTSSDSYSDDSGDGLSDGSSRCSDEQTFTDTSE